MATAKPARRKWFRGIARTLWIALAVLLAAMLGEAWFNPPPEGFAVYARTSIGTVVLCFLAAPFVTSAIIWATRWMNGEDPNSEEEQ
jgi:hypothetical protein